MDCADVPVTFEELREWRAERGVPYDIYDALETEAESLVQDLEAGGCEILPSDYSWTGPCTTDNGYRVEGSGWDDTYAGDHGFSITITATASADGSLPTGQVDYEWSSDGGGSYDWDGRGLHMAWTFEAPGSSSIGADGDVDAWRSSGVSDDCGSIRWMGVSGTFQGCDVAVTWDLDSEFASATGAIETETFAVNEWSASVTTYACRNTVGVLLGRTAFLDDDWRELVRTDADGDHCAAEDCDCDDGDAAVSPNVYDESGDGRDRDCDGQDYSGWSCNVWDPGNRCDVHEDTGATDDSGSDDSGSEDSGGDTAGEDSAPDDSADTATPDSTDTASATPPPTSDPDCTGCATPANPGGTLLLALAALLRRRR